MTAVNQKEYLKKYLGIGKSHGTKKKRKKSEKTLGKSLKIIDDDLDVSLSEEIKEDLAGDKEDAPQIVSVIDDRPPSLRIDERTKSKNWKPIGTVESDQEEENATYSKDSKELYSFCQDLVQIHKNNISGKIISVMDPASRNKKDLNVISKRHLSSPDISPSRIKNEYFPVKEQSPSDISPPRINSRSKKFDLSPRRTINQDYSPERRRNSNGDQSPQRRRNFNAGDRSPKQQKTSDDQSPRRRRNWDSGDQSPQRQKNGTSGDQSPKRRKPNDADESRRRQRNWDSEEHFSRGRKNSDSSVQSAKNKKSQSADYSPKRKSSGVTKDLSPKLRKNGDGGKSNKEYVSKKNTRKDSTRPKISRWGENSPDSSDVTIGKPEKTLSGRKSGLQKANDLIHELTALKERENELFSKMTAAESGENAATILRKKKTISPEEEAEQQKKQKDLEEKYSRWGKGIKQVEDRDEKWAEQLAVMSKPLARYADDEDLEKYLKEQERVGDPMLMYMRKKKKKKAVEAGVSEKPVYLGEFMPNRFGIPPGYRWDGVDRSNGYEVKLLSAKNSEKAKRDEAFMWNTEDM